MITSSCRAHGICSQPNYAKHLPYPNLFALAVFVLARFDCSCDTATQWPQRVSHGYIHRPHRVSHGYIYTGLIELAMDIYTGLIELAMDIYTGLIELAMDIWPSFSEKQS